MPGPTAIAISLSEEMRQGLEILTKGHSTAQQIAKRARIILSASEGKDNGIISREVGVSRKTVYNWRERWLSLAPMPCEGLSIKERLEDLPRAGAPPRITAEQRCEMEALACEVPEQSGRPISQWEAFKKKRQYVHIASVTG